MVFLYHHAVRLFMHSCADFHIFENLYIALPSIIYPRDMNQYGKNVDSDGTKIVRINVGIMAKMM